VVSLLWSSQLRQFVDGRVELEVCREQVQGARVDEPVGLPDRHVRHAGDVSDLWGGGGERETRKCRGTPGGLALALVSQQSPTMCHC